MMISLMLALPLLAPPVLAEEGDDSLDDEFAMLADEEQVFAASRHVQEVNESPFSVTIITRAQIEHTACFDVTCLLRSVPGVEVLRMRPFYHVVGAGAVTHGLGDKTLVLIDGREESLEAFGFPFWSALPVHLEDIERIEIIRGPGSALYGANAHSMVVSITTRAPRDNRAEVFLSGGEAGRFQFNARVDQITEDWRLQVSGGRELGESWQDPEVDGLDLMRFRIRADRDWGQTIGKTSTQVGLVSGGGQIHTALAPIKLHNTHAMHAMIEHKRDPVEARVWFNLFDTLFDVDLPLAYQGFVVAEIPPNIPILSTTLDGEVLTHWTPWRDNLLVAGVNYRWLTLVNEMNDPPKIHQHRLGLFLQDEQRLFDQLTLSAGLRMDYNNITPLTFSPRASAVWRFASEQVLRLTGGTAFRKPSFFNTHMHVTGVEGGALLPDLEDFIRRSVGNDELDNESVTSVELGYRGRFLDGRLTAEARSFANLYRNRIEFSTDLVYDQWNFPILAESEMGFSNNASDINAFGGSLTLSAKPFSALRLDANYTYRYCVFASTPLTSEAAPGTESGDRVGWAPAHLANFSARYTTGFGLHLGFSLHYSSSSEWRRVEDGDPFNPRITLNSPEVIFSNAFLSWRLGLGPEKNRWIELGLKAYNLFDQEFTDAQAVIRGDGAIIGAEKVGRLFQIFARGAI
ncbi:MAG: TonB-dependent receptor [Deltaproteobacteria bacterium]|nr:TonB-dependent receptor [Deltaproteobacteria bacterium]